MDSGPDSIPCACLKLARKAPFYQEFFFAFESIYVLFDGIPPEAGKDRLWFVFPLLRTFMEYFFKILTKRSAEHLCMRILNGLNVTRCSGRVYKSHGNIDFSYVYHYFFYQLQVEITW
jgi:hypothetical protein